MGPPNDNAVEIQRSTRVLGVDAAKIGQFCFEDAQQRFLGEWHIQVAENSPDVAHMQEAASLLRKSDRPVAFPTETVYGLGADATRSSAVRGIYAAKQRPSDNPLIVHISSLSQLRQLLTPRASSTPCHQPAPDPIPHIYHSLITRCWPGPLTILLPLPSPSPVAAEVTNSIPTVAVRMPSSLIALALIQLAGVPLAAPSANASSKPSPTTAAHVLFDLSGRIDLILDGGPCNVGVESTVVDGMTTPPVVLRPGGISIDMIRDCSGWEDVKVAYKDGAETGVPRAPGMKYKHYSPNARVILFHGQLDATSVARYLKEGSLGVVRTKTWNEHMLQTESQPFGNHINSKTEGNIQHDYEKNDNTSKNMHLDPAIATARIQPVPIAMPSARFSQVCLHHESTRDLTSMWTIEIGPTATDVARGLFSALRELDQRGVDIIFVEGMDDNGGDTAAAVMNRLRKAAEIEVTL